MMRLVFYTISHLPIIGKCKALLTDGVEMYCYIYHVRRIIVLKLFVQ